MQLIVKQFVSHDRLDDEVMVIDLHTGSYYAFDGAAADAWTLVVAGADAEYIGSQLAQRYSVDPMQASSDVAHFVEQLMSEGVLVAEAGDSVREPASLPELANAQLPYEAPVIDKYEDLQDLLLLDPIHEVEDGGWPKGRAD